MHETGTHDQFCSYVNHNFSTAIHKNIVNSIFQIKLASGAVVQARINMNHNTLWVDLNIGLPSFDYKHVDGMCGSWDRNGGNDKTEWRASPKDSLFFYKARGGRKCLAKDACNPEKKFKAQGGWQNLVFPGIMISHLLQNENLRHAS